MLWIACHCPFLPLDRIRRRWPEGLAASVPPLAIVVGSSSGGQRRILMADDKAATAGVRRGQSVASALALLPGLALFERDLRDEAAAVEALALSALRFTPAVVRKPTGLLAEVAASLRLFGGRDALFERLAAVLRGAGLRVALDWAATPAAAWLLARNAAVDAWPATAPEDSAARLDALPLGLLETVMARPAVADVLQGMGCRSIGDVRALPRAGLTRRFGPELLEEIDRATGKRPDPQDWLVPPERFDVELDMLARIEHVEGVLHATAHLLAQLAGWLGARHAALAALTLTLVHEDRHACPPTQLTVRLAEPLADIAHLGNLLRERLTRQPLAAPVDALRLTVDDIVTRGAGNRELFATVHSETSGLYRLIEKLVARLGPEAVQRLAAVADHRPEHAWQMQCADQAPQPAPGAGKAQGRSGRATPGADAAPASTVATTANAATAATAGPDRPVWLLDAPRPLRIEQHKPVYGGSALRMLAGPERIESGWWDDALATRDYFIAANEAGQLLWVYRERQVLGKASAWYLHGLFG